MITSDPSRTANSLRIERRLAAPPERVFAAWTRPEELKQWTAPAPLHVSAAEVDLRVGGRYRIAMEAPDGAVHVATGEYREIVPGTRLAYTWRWQHWLESHADSLVTVEFTPRGDGTTLVLTHTGLPDEDSVTQHTKGWEGCLANLGPHLGVA
jgi:uncharacterized protein YndB with AHSA1/START domain